MNNINKLQKSVDHFEESTTKSSTKFEQQAMKLADNWSSFMSGTNKYCSAHIKEDFSEYVEYLDFKNDEAIGEYLCVDCGMPQADWQVEQEFVLEGWEEATKLYPSMFSDNPLDV